MNKASFSLKAINEPLNVKRYYKVKMGQNLFGDWEVLTSYGRIGQKGQAKLYNFDSLDHSLKKLKIILHKRFKSAKRIGCPYILDGFSMEDQFARDLSTHYGENFVYELFTTPRPLPKKNQ